MTANGQFYLQVYAPGIGVVQKMALSAQGRDTVTFDLDSSMDFGPTIAFRARCPGGETERYVLGTDRTSATESAGPGFRISSVMPNQINLDRAFIAGNGDLPDGAGIPVTIFGRELTPECKPSATVDGREVELMNVWAQRGQITRTSASSNDGVGAVSSM